MKDFGRYDPLTFAMSQPDRMAELLSGAVNNHFTAPPFGCAEAHQPGIRTIATGEQILGDPATFIVTWATSKFRLEIPLTYNAFLAATEDAIDTNNKNPKRAFAIYLEMSHDKMSEAGMLPLFLDRETRFTTTPQNVMTYAKFMPDVGTMKTPGRGRNYSSPTSTAYPGARNYRTSST